MNAKRGLLRGPVAAADQNDQLHDTASGDRAGDEQAPSALHPIPERLLHPLPEVQELLGIKRTLLYEILGAGRLETVQIGKRRLVPRAALIAFVEALRESNGRAQ